MAATIGTLATGVEVHYIDPADLERDYSTYISKGGFVMESAKQMELWQEINLEFLLPGQLESVSLKGKIVRIHASGTTKRKSGAAVSTFYLELMDLEDNARRKFEDCIMSNTTLLPMATKTIAVHNFDDPVRETVDCEAIVYRFKSWGDLRDKYNSDLSSGGLSIRTDKFIPINTPVTVKLVHPDDNDELELVGTVVSHVASGIGGLDTMDIIFTGQKSSDEKIEHFVLNGLSRGIHQKASAFNVSQSDERKEECLFSGSVKRHGIPELVKMICKSQIEGRLRVSRDGESAEIAFSGGRILKAEMKESEFPIDSVSDSSLTVRILKYLVDWEVAKFQCYLPTLPPEGAHL